MGEDIKPGGTPTASALAGAASWARIGSGLGMSLLLLLGAGILFIHFLQTRPVNLRPHSEALIGQVLRSLQDLYIPDDSVTLGDPVARREGRVSWLEYPVEVRLPDHMDVDGFLQLLTQNLLQYEIAVRAVADAPDVRRLTFGNYDFGRLTVLGQHRAPEPLVQDLSEPTAHLAREVESALAGAGQPVELIQRQPALEQRDEAASWQLWPLRTTAASMAAADALYEAVAKSMDARADVELQYSQGDAGAELRIHYMRRPAISLKIEVPQAAPAVSAPTRPAMRSPLPAPVTPPLPAAPPAAPAPPSPVVAPVPPRLDGAATPPRRTPVEWAEPAQAPPLEELPLDKVEGEAESLRPQASSLPPAALLSGEKPKVALILDDGGYGNGYTETILTLSPKLTLAILPNAPFSTETAERAAALGFEIMLHMPMQTSASKTTFPGQINVDMTREEIHELANDAMDQIPFMIGVNNHTGSVYTCNAEKMREFLEIVQERDLYFIDSLTRGCSQAFQVAREMGIPSARRDIFLDHVMTRENIRARFQEMLDLAKERGSCIGIGHFRALTVNLLVELLPQIELQGLELVHASELIQ